MQELRSEVVGDRHVRLVVQTGEYFAVTLEVRGPQGWEDISLRADRDPLFAVAGRCYRQRLTEQMARAIDWNTE